MAQWQLQTAKAQLSEVLRASGESGPQEITRRGQAVAVVLAKADFDRLTSKKGSFVDFVHRSPLRGMDLGLGRRRSRARRGRQ
jgi:prevent-host-death family protein